MTTSLAPNTARPTRSIAGRTLARPVRWYRRVPRARPPVCRYAPTCSEYAIEALEQHGPLRGTWLAVRRVCRCHPWAGQGWDPVPTPKGN